MITFISLVSILLSAVVVYLSMRLIHRQSMLAEYWQNRHETVLRVLRDADPPTYRRVILSSVLQALR